MPTRPALQLRGHKAGRMKHRTPFFAVICVDDAGKARRALGAQVIREGDFAP